MKISYFPNQCAQNSTPVIEAMLSSLTSAGHVCVQDSMDADAVIVWSVLWHGKMISNQVVWNHYRKLGRPVIVVDVGALIRGVTWKIAVGSITADGYYGHQENLDFDRPKKLGLKLLTNTSTNPRIIIAAQHSRSLQTANIVVEQWIQEQIVQLRTTTDRPIIIRPHPRSQLDCTQLRLTKNETVEHPQKIPNTYDSYDLPFDCYAMVNYNSGPGIQAALAGARIVVDQTSLAWPVSTPIQDIEKSYTVDRTQWLVEICHTEYTLEEIKQGSWLKRIQLALHQL